MRDIHDTISLKWILAKIQKLGFQMDSNVDQHGNRVYHVWPFEEGEQDKTIPRLVHSIPYDKSSFKMSFVRMGDTDSKVRNIRLNGSVFPLSTSAKLKVMERKAYFDNWHILGKD